MVALFAADGEILPHRSSIGARFDLSVGYGAILGDEVEVQDYLAGSTDSAVAEENLSLQQVSMVPATEDEMHLESVAAQLRIPAAGRALCTDWEAAMGLPPGRAQPLLDPVYVAQAARQVDLTEAMINVLTDFAERIARDRNVVAFFWYCPFRVPSDRTRVHFWEEPRPPLDDCLGPDAGLLNVLVMLSAVPGMQAIYRRLGIPADIVRDTVADLRLWMGTDLYYHRDRRWGITAWIARWLCKHWQGKLLQLGRLQFSLSTFGGRLRAYRNRTTREVLALAEPGIRYCSDGNAWGAGCGEDPGGWISTVEKHVEAVVGKPILPNGLALPQPRRLALGDWDLALAPGGDMLTFHAPAAGSLTFEGCGGSSRQALDTLPRYFPELEFRGFWTRFRLMDTRLESLLSPKSNIVRMRRVTYAFPGLQGDNQQIYHRVIGWGVTDITRVPWATSLRKAVGRYLRNGGRFHGGYGFFSERISRGAIRCTCASELGQKCQQ